MSRRKGDAIRGCLVQPFLTAFCLISLCIHQDVRSQAADIPKLIFSSLRGGVVWTGWSTWFHETRTWRYGFGVLYGIPSAKDTVKTNDSTTASGDGIAKHITLVSGYEYSASYQLSKDRLESTVPLGGIYLAALYNLKKPDPRIHGPYFGAGVGFFSISDATGTSIDELGNCLALKFSTETTLATELYAGVNMVPLFLQCSFQYMKFVSVRYTPATTATPISSELYLNLPGKLPFYRCILEIGITLQ